MTILTLPRHIETLRASPLGRTAFHEAGHAVIARILNVTISSVTVVGCGSTAGHVALPLLGTGELGGVLLTDMEWLAVSGTLSKRVSLPTTKALHAHILTLLAGAAAEKQFCGGAVHLGARNDNAQVRQLMRHTSRDRRRLKRMAHQLVRRHSGHILHVAVELARKKTLRANTLDRIIHA